MKNLDLLGKKLTKDGYEYGWTTHNGFRVPFATIKTKKGNVEVRLIFIVESLISKSYTIVDVTYINITYKNLLKELKKLENLINERECGEIVEHGCHLGDIYEGNGKDEIVWFSDNY